MFKGAGEAEIFRPGGGGARVLLSLHIGFLGFIDGLLIGCC